MQSPATSGRIAIAGRTEAQNRTLRSMAREFAYSGRRFGGKSFIGCGKGLIYAWKYPGAKVLVAREERASMENTTLRTLRDEIVPRDLWAACWRETKSALHLPNGSVIDVQGLDRPERILGARYGMAVVDQAEQLSFQQFEIVNSCVMQPGLPWHQTLLLFNPGGPDHWAFKRYQPDLGDGPRSNPRFDADGRPFAEVAHVLPSDLVDLLTEESRRRFDSLTGVLRDRLRLGLWVAAEGVVFSESWAGGRYVVDAPAEWAAWNGFPPAHWPRHRAIDFGYANPFVCSWWAEDPDGRLWRYRELYHSRRRTEEHARLIVRLEAEELEALRAAPACDEQWARANEHAAGRLYVDLTISDHDPEAMATLAQHGIMCTPAVKDRKAGMEAVESALVGDRLRFVRGALVESDGGLAEEGAPTCTEEEIPALRFPPAKATSVEEAERESPMKKNDHGYDALCYLLCTRERVWRYV